MVIVCYAVAAAIVGYFLGKRAIDSLVDANIKGFKNTVLMTATGIVIIILCILFTKLRISYIVALPIYLAGVAIGFLWCILRNPNRGLKVKWNEQAGNIVRDLVFDSTRPETGYDLYLPASKESDGTYALVLYVHGGGFTGGSRKDGETWCKYMTAKGYVSASMDYTLQGKKGSQTSNLHLMAGQVKDCVAAIKVKCEELGYPVTEMTVTGASAGGTIAALFAYGLAKESAVPVKFIFQQTGPMLFHPVWWGATNNDYKMQAMFVGNFSGKAVTVEMVERGEHLPIIEAMSPACLVRENTVPTLCAYGPRDKMVPACLKFALFEALERYQVPYDYVEYPHSNHGLYDDPKAQRVFVQKVDEYCEKYFDHKPLKAER